MLKVENFNTDSVVIDITDTKRIEVRKSFGTDMPDSWFREMKFIDNNGRCVTIKLYGKTKEDLEIKEIEY